MTGAPTPWAAGRRSVLKRGHGLAVQEMFVPGPKK